MNYLSRQRRLAADLERAKAQALLVTQMANVRYLCGFTGSSGVLLIFAGGRASHPSPAKPAGLGTPASKPVLYTDGRYAQQAADEVQGATVIVSKKTALTEAARHLLRRRVGAVAFEAE